MTKSNNYERVLRAWVEAEGLDQAELDQGSVCRAAFTAAWRYSRMTWKATKAELESKP